MLPIEIQTQQDPKRIDQVRIVPRNGHYVIEVVYSKEPVQAQVDPSFCVAIDLGVTNLAAITANREGFIPRLVNGRTLKAMNQWYNKRMRELKLRLPKDDRERVKPVFLIWTPSLPTNPMMTQRTPLAGSGLDGETVYIAQKTERSSVRM
jgi:hypothetical protein